MNQTEITWLGLRTDREKEIYAEAFWVGVNASESLKQEERHRETKWIFFERRNNKTEVRPIVQKDDGRNELDGYAREDICGV